MQLNQTEWKECLKKTQLERQTKVGMQDLLHERQLKSHYCRIIIGNEEKHTVLFQKRCRPVIAPVKTSGRNSHDTTGLNRDVARLN